MNQSRETIKYSAITVTGFVCLVSMLVGYLYFLNMSVVEVVMRTEFTGRQQSLHAEIAVLEASFIEAQHEIASRIGTLQGYSTEAEKIFVSRDATTRVVLGNTR